MAAVRRRPARRRLARTLGDHAAEVRHGRRKWTKSAAWRAPWASSTPSLSSPPRGTGGSTRLIGYNTDVAGIVNALRHAGRRVRARRRHPGRRRHGRRRLAALQELGAPAVDVFVRDPQPRRRSARRRGGPGVPLQVQPLTGAAAAVGRGRRRHLHAAAARRRQRWREPNGRPPQPRETRARPGVLLDVAYDPWPSRIASVWQDAGGTVVPGLEMLHLPGGGTGPPIHPAGRGRSGRSHRCDV